MTQLTEADEGKPVVNSIDQAIGIVADVEHGTAHVKPDPGLTDKLMATLGWSDRDEDTYRLEEEAVGTITDDEVCLVSTVDVERDAGT
jgi:hypothetical protein